MRTLEEIHEQRNLLLPIANSPTRSRNRELAQNLVHLLSWVAGETEYLPPIEMIGWIETNLPELAAAVNREYEQLKGKQGARGKKP